MSKEIYETSKLDQAISILKIDSLERSPESSRELMNFLISHYSYFKSLQRRIGEQQFEQFVETAKCQLLTFGEYIENEGQASTRFGLILKGKVKINGSNQGKKSQLHKPKMFLKQGDRVGSESMLFKKANVFSLTAESERVTLFFVDKISFQKYLRPIEEDRFMNQMTFLKSTQLFRHISDQSVLTMLLYNSLKLNFEAGEIVYNQDSQSYAIYIVLGGKFQVSKNLGEQFDGLNDSLMSCEANDQDNFSMANKHHSISSDAGFNVSTNIKIRTAEQGDVFGEEEIIEKIPRTCSVICTQDLSSLLVIRPILFSPCIFRFEAVKQQLIELASQRSNEIREKEQQKRNSYQSLGNRSRKSSACSPKSSQNSPKNTEAKTSKFAKAIMQIKSNPGEDCQNRSPFSSFLYPSQSPKQLSDKTEQDPGRISINMQDNIYESSYSLKSQIDSTQQASPFSFSQTIDQSPTSRNNAFLLQKQQYLIKSPPNSQLSECSKEAEQQLDWENQNGMAQNQLQESSFPPKNSKQSRQNDDSQYLSRNTSQKQEQQNSCGALKHFFIRQQVDKKDKKSSTTKHRNGFNSQESNIQKEFQVQNKPINPIPAFKRFAFPDSFSQTQKDFPFESSSSFQDSSQIIKKGNTLPKVLLGEQGQYQFSFQREPWLFQEKLSDKNRFQGDKMILFSSNKNHLPLNNVNVKLRKAMHLNSSKNINNSQVDSIFEQKVSISPAILLPHCQSLSSPISKIYSTELNLKNLHSLKKTLFIDKPLPIETILQNKNSKTYYQPDRISNLALLK